MSLSSTAVVLRTLGDRAELDSDHGRNSLAVLLLQDIAVVPLLALIVLLVTVSVPEFRIAPPLFPPIITAA